MSNHLNLNALNKSFGAVVATKNVSLTVEKGECLALLGPSGCGKTTILRLIAGLESPDSGQVLLAERDITKLPPESRNIGLVFQSYALFPHLSVAENVAFGLKARRKPPQIIADKVKSALALVQLEGLGQRRIHELSGGQQQRVAIARALAIEPEVLLLDEPLSNLDVALRAQTGEQLRNLIKQLQITAIFVTHDQEDAFTLADRIALLKGGELQQLGSAEALYFSPNNLFVANFIGRSNTYKATLIKVLDANLAEYQLAEGVKLQVATPKPIAQADLIIRPEAIKILNSTVESPTSNTFAAQLVSTRFTGATQHYQLKIGSLELSATTFSTIQPLTTPVVNISIVPTDIRLFPTL